MGPPARAYPEVHGYDRVACLSRRTQAGDFIGSFLSDFLFSNREVNSGRAYGSVNRQRLSPVSIFYYG